MKNKKYCKDCKYYDELSPICNLEIDSRKFSEFSEQVLSGKLQKVYRYFNNTGNCPYYESDLFTKIKNFFKGRK